MRTILIAYEFDSLESLTTELGVYCPGIEIIGTFTDPRKALAFIKNEKPELVFLDIEMPFLNAFEVLQQCLDVPLKVIFVTAYDQYAIKAFDFNALDYILKPVMKSKLVSAVQKALDKQITQIDLEQLRALMNNLGIQNKPGLESIAIPTSEGFEFVHISKITYLQAESNYTWVFLHNQQQKYLVSRTLKEMANMLEFPQFFRTHQSFYVNLNYAKKYIRGQGGSIIMQNGAEIPVSRSNRDALIKMLSG